MSIRELDVVIVGAGPAGLAAAAVVAEAELDCSAIDRMGPGGQLMNLGVLVGVDGFAPDTTGPDLLAHLTDRAMSTGAELAIDDVTAIAREGSRFVIEALDARYEAAAVIVASGLTPGTTGLADEARFEGTGLSHCAHCDAPLYADLPVAVAGSDAWSVEEAIELAGYASQVTLIFESTLIAPADRLSVLKASGNVTAVEGRITALEGADALEAVQVAGTSGSGRIPARGLFLQSGRVPALALLTSGLVAADGVFIAGDARGRTGRTIAEAIADGRRAGQDAIAWVKTQAGARAPND